MARTASPSAERRVQRVLVLLCSLLVPGAVAGQLPVASPGWQASGGSATATLRGAGAPGGNPAALGLPTNPSWSLILPSGALQVGLEPVTGRDLSRWGGRRLPETEREEWLERITSSGGERGVLRGEFTAMSHTRGRWGIQAGTMAVGSASLNPDAAELLLFGNAGRTGEPGDFDLAGSELDLGVYSTVALSAGLPVDFRIGDRRSQAAAVGVTVKYTEGNVLLVGRDAGSILRSEPVEVDLRFPVVQADTMGHRFRNGGGWGVDVGGAWEGGPWSLALVLENLFHSFAWDPGQLVYRAGEALFQGSGSHSDFDAVPLDEAPPGFRALVEELRFRPVVTAALAWERDPTTTLTAAWRERQGGGIATGPRRTVAAGVEHRGVDHLPLRAGVARITGGWEFSAGAGLTWRSAELQAAASLQRGATGPATRIAVGLVFVPVP